MEYHHVIFTLPAEVAELALANPAVLYDALFQAAAATLRDVAANSKRLGAQLEHVLGATQPDVLHVHSLLNLSFMLPRLARARGVAVAATLHDHSLACPAGGQRLHLVERTVCHDIEPARCAACFPHSPFHAQLTVAGLGRPAGGGGCPAC